MERFVKLISPRVEFSIVILIAFGYFIYSSTLYVINPGSGAHISESHFRMLLIYESVVTLLLWRFLSLRGWKLRRVGLIPTLEDTAIGFGLFLIAYIAYVIIWTSSVSFMPGLRENTISLVVAPDLNLTTVLLISVLNPVFEELFVCGYIVAALKNSQGISFAVNVSVAIRLAYHLYQGATGVMNIIPLGFIFGYWFAKTGRLWPVVVAHAIFDLLGLMAYTQM